MSEDYQNEQYGDAKFMKALGHIRYILATFDRTLDEFNLPGPDARGADWRHRQLPQFQDDMTAQQHADAIENLGATLNNEQRNVNDTVMAAVLNRDPTPSKKCYFLDGTGGTGETYVIILIILLILT
ncbi:ATP-dependent DNA helicase pfh1-like [Brachionus plicatilis]|uniref:ATP-dependent DNA helicase pfh1-like n=1 Tax=Brachionus plicatilis TaxID=10195 RepID=A0A3M7PUL1_BRAPC|nr:ATP-dependent DNA helicase pfh1-like [Brachionus plicatilis]